MKLLAISSLDAPLRNASVRIMIIMKGFLFSICFISLSTNLKRSIDIFIMSKLIKHVLISWPLVVSYFKKLKLTFNEYKFVKCKLMPQNGALKRVSRVI